MVRFSLDDEAAFQMLVKSSQAIDVKLKAVAHRLTGEVGQRSAGPAPATGSPEPRGGARRSTGTGVARYGR